ncbi:MAG: hypothetical protein Q9175_005766 [Cornicularia normoerica]
MKDLFRETVFGRLVYLVSGAYFFRRDEELDPSIILSYTLDHSESSSRSNLDGVHTDTEKGKEKRLVEWTENDPHNPRNWSTPKKVFVIFQICLLTTSVYIGSAIYTAGIPGIQQRFQVSEVKALLGLTLFVVGYALGPMVWAPMSEVPYIGRNPVYVGTLIGFVVLQFGVIYAKNFSMLLAFRFISGFVGSPVLATGGATIADLYKPSKQVYGIAIWGISAVLGPAMGPLIGGFAAESKNWQWPLWELTWLSGFCLVFLVFFLPETSSSNIIYRRAVHIRKATGDINIKCEPELEAEGMSTQEILLMVFIRPFTLTLKEPICFALNLYIALAYGLLYLWFESFPIVFGQIYHFSQGLEGLAFLGILMGAFVVMIPFFYYSYRFVEPQFNHNGELRPEIRLQPAMVGAFFIPVCLFWFGWTSRESVHWIVPIIGTSFFSIGTFLLFMAVLGYLGDAYPKYVASVYASNDLVRSGFGAAFPLFANAMYSKLGIAWASSLLGFLAVAFIPIPFVLYFYGKRIRLSSKMARHDL